MKALRVLHICQRDDIRDGGAYKVALDLNLEFQSMPDVESLIVFLYGEPGYAAEKEELSVEFLGLNSSKECWKFLKLYQAIKNFKPDVIHDHQGVLWSRVITHLQRTAPVISHTHLSATNRKAKWNSRLSTILAAKADHLICITENTKKSWKEAYKLPDKKLNVVYNGIHLSEIDLAKDESAEQDLPKNKKLVGFVGRLSDQHKGVSDFIRMISYLSNDWTGVIVGDGEDRVKLENLSQELGLQERILFLGSVQDVAPLYHRFHAFCLTSHFEDFGLVVIEAMAARVPVIGFECEGGIQEVLIPEAGVIIPNREHQAMAQAVESILDSSFTEEWRNRIERARQRCEDDFNWKLNAKKIVEIYRTL